MKKHTMYVAIAYALVYLVWGSTFFFIKMSVESIPPAVVVGVRWFLGGALFLAIAALRQGWTVPTAREIGSATVMGLLLILVPNGLVTMVERTMDSYLVALLAVLTPISVAVFDRVLLGRRIRPPLLAGMIIGIAGVALLVCDGRCLQAGITKETALLLGAFSCIGFGTSIGGRMGGSRDALTVAGLQMATSGVICLAVVALTAPGQFAAYAAFSGRSLAGLAYLVVFGSLAFGAYNYLLKHEPAVRITSYALINPLIAVALGLMVGKEAPVRSLAAGMPVIVAGLVFMFYGEQIVEYVRLAGKLLVYNAKAAYAAGGRDE